MKIEILKVLLSPLLCTENLCLACLQKDLRKKTQELREQKETIDNLQAAVSFCPPSPSLFTSFSLDFRSWTKRTVFIS
jgi:hypothetical protein